jgi:uncharacterized protein
MTQVPARRHFATASGIVLGLALAAGRCASPSSPPPASAQHEAAATAPRCRGTLGFEADQPSRSARKKLALSPDFHGAVVSAVMAGGPAAAAGILTGDIVEQIGSTRLAAACAFADLAFNRPCEPVRVLVQRGGATRELLLTPVDQTAFYAAACHGGNATACFRQAWLGWKRHSAPASGTPNPFADACQMGSADACAYGGLDLVDAGRDEEALPLLNASCDHGSAGGCATLAFLYVSGRGVRKDERRAGALYDKSCDLGDPQGCYNAGIASDQARGSSRDDVRAAARYTEGCDMGSSTACTNLGFLYEHGRGVKEDAARAFELYERGCDGSSCQPSNLGGCVNAGRCYRDGKGTKTDEAKAAAIFQDACDRRVDSDDIHSAENGARACSLLGALHLAGDGIPKDLEKALQLSLLGCERHDAFGCFNVSAIYTAGSGVPADRAKAAQYLDLACQAGDGEGCYDLAIAYEKGNGVAADRRRGADLRRKACELGYASACAKKRS